VLVVHDSDEAIHSAGRRTWPVLRPAPFAPSGRRRNSSAAHARRGQLVISEREPATVMSWTAACSGLRAVVTRARRQRHAHQALAQELAAYAGPTDRDELAALIEGRGHLGCEEAEILARVAHVDILRDGNPPLWPITSSASVMRSRPGAG
jgi:hypothetical protein